MWAELSSEYGHLGDMILYDREKPPGDELAQMYGIFYQPVFVVLDAEGELIEQRAGINNGDDLREFVEGHLAAPQP